MIRKFLAATIFSLMFTACVFCNDCNCDAEPPQRDVSVSFYSSSDSTQTRSFMERLTFIIQTGGNTDTSRPEPLEFSPNHLGLRRYLGNVDSLRVDLLFNDSLITSSLYLTPDTLFHDIAFTPDSWRSCVDKQVVFTDGSDTLFVCHEKSMPYCM
jgi:hypothetical protein